MPAPIPREPPVTSARRPASGALATSSSCAVSVMTAPYVSNGSFAYGGVLKRHVSTSFRWFVRSGQVGRGLFFRRDFPFGADECPADDEPGYADPGEHPECERVTARERGARCASGAQ